MIKKLCLLGICIVGLLRPCWAQLQLELQGPASFEFLAYASIYNTYGGGPSWILAPSPTNIATSFESPVLLSFVVPPSPKSPAVFLELWGWYGFAFSSDTIRICKVAMGITLTSPEFPNIEFAQAAGIPPTDAETNNSADSSLPGYDTRHYRYVKMPVARGDLSMWWIRYRDTKAPVPNDEAIIYINKFIDSGFTVEIYATGTVAGVSRLRPLGFTAEATRIISKNNR